MMVKTIKVSEKGQVSIPAEMREDMGISKGDNLLIIQDRGKIMIEKVPKRMKKEFSDMLKHSEKVAKKLWGNRADEIWNKV